ncbi:MAG: anti-sigma factor family protein [Woeseiaceae bacterium]
MTERPDYDHHESIDGLLPWFVNHTLSPAEHERVRRHLGGCEECRANVELLSVVQSTVRRAATTPMVPPPRTGRLRDAIDTLEQGQRRRRWLRTPAAATAALGFALLAVMLLMPDRRIGDSSPARFETATSAARQAGMDYVLVLQFEPGAAAADQDRLLRELEARDISRGQPEGSYRVTVSLAATSLAELERFTGDLEALPEVRSASVVALQLPVQRRP